MPRSTRLVVSAGSDASVSFFVGGVPLVRPQDTAKTIFQTRKLPKSTFVTVGWPLWILREAWDDRAKKHYYAVLQSVTWRSDILVAINGNGNGSSP